MELALLNLARRTTVISTPRLHWPGVVGELQTSFEQADRISNVFLGTKANTSLYAFFYKRVGQSIGCSDLNCSGYIDRQLALYHDRRHRVFPACRRLLCGDNHIRPAGAIENPPLALFIRPRSPHFYLIRP